MFFFIVLAPCFVSRFFSLEPLVAGSRCRRHVRFAGKSQAACRSRAIRGWRVIRG